MKKEKPYEDSTKKMRMIIKREENQLRRRSQEMVQIIIMPSQSPLLLPSLQGKRMKEQSEAVTLGILQLEEERTQEVEQSQLLLKDQRRREEANSSNLKSLQSTLTYLSFTKIRHWKIWIS